jgi:hypothetical protein
VTHVGLAGVTLVTLTVVATAPAWASHGGRDHLRLAEAGPYVVSAWTRPDPVTVDGFSVSVSVMRPADRSPVLDATVRLVVAPTDRGDPPRMVEAPRGVGPNRLYHHAEIKVPRPGRWELSISVEGRAGTGSTSVELDVGPSGRERWLAVALAVSLAMGTVAVRAWRAGRHRRREPVTAAGRSSGARPPG